MNWQDTYEIDVLDYDKNITHEDVNIRLLARSLDIDTFTKLLDDWLNDLSKGRKTGEAVGRKLRTAHRTQQRSIIVFCLGVISGLSDQEFTDDRNRDAILSAKKIKEMVDSGKLNLGMFI